MKKIITIAVVMILLTLFAYPAIAEDIYNTEVRKSTYRLAWGNGQDDDGDGVIDNWEEADVQNGTKEVDPDNTTSDTWNSTFTFPNDLEKGVVFDAYASEIFQINSNNNVSVSPTQTCYYTELDYGEENITQYLEADNVLNICTFYMNLSPGDVMNGAQEIWYRSPLVWNDEDNSYETHRLNIYNSEDQLVFASANDSLTGLKPKYNTDDSAIDGVGGERVYYKLNFNFRTEEKYRFEEYVETTDDNPINSVKLYMARSQDIGQDDETDTYVFKGSEYARKIPIESSWSAVCTIGIGRAGTEGVVFSEDDSSHKFSIYTNKVQGDPDIDDTGSVSFIFPLRTTKPLDIMVSVKTFSGSSSTSFSTIKYVENVTGTIILSTNITDPDVTEPNEYQLVFYVTNLNESDNNAMMYSMYPSVGTSHVVVYPSGNREVRHFAAHLEVAGESTDSLPDGAESSTPDAASLLIGIGLVTAGVVLTAFVISAAPGLTLIAAGVGIASASVVTGGYFIAQGLEGVSPSQVIGNIGSGIARVSTSIIEGVKSVAGDLWNVVIEGWEILKDIGSAVAHWAGVVFEAVAEIIWLIAFLVVIWIWSRFLEIMGYITRGDPEAAGRTIEKTGSSIGKRVKKVKRIIPSKKKKSNSGKARTKRWYQR